MDYLVLISICAAGIGLFGWSHKAIRQRLDRIEVDMVSRPNQVQIRQLINDMLEPHKVEYTDLARRMMELKEDQKEMSKKMDKIIELCQKLK